MNVELPGGVLAGVAMYPATKRRACVTSGWYKSWRDRPDDSRSKWSVVLID